MDRKETKKETAAGGQWNRRPLVALLLYVLVLAAVFILIFCFLTPIKQFD